MSFEGQDRRSAGYRREIDGIRAIAVIAVMGFHAGFNGFHGGYAGVDIFFVISGYLITGIIAREREAGHFSFGSFYRRRALRILPALVTILSACTLLALFVPDPSITKAYGSEMAAAMLFGANFLFWRLPSGYFGPGVDDLPLIHLWSLSVEEHFYLLFPAAFVLCHRYARRLLLPALLAALIASLSLSEWASTHMTSANYFLLPMRSWELLAGAVLALTEPFWRRAPIPIWAGEMLAIAGLGLIAYTVITFGPETRFPGLSATPAVIGSALLLAFARPGRPAGIVLGSRPFVAAGLLSYSAYLWHQPLLAFARAYAIDNIDTAEAAGILILSFALAAITWRFVEQPFRRTQHARSPLLLAAGFCAIVACVIVGTALWALDGLPQRFSPRHNALLALGPSEANRELPCFLSDAAPRPFEQGCTSGTEGPLNTVVFGDSHAVALKPAMDLVMTKRNERALFLTQAGCPPTLEMPEPGSWYARCAPFNRRIFAWLTQHREIGTVVLAARWSFYMERRWVDNGEGGVERGPLVPPSDAPLRREMARTYAEAVKTLLAARKRVVLIYPDPEPGWVVPATMAKRELYGLVSAPLTTSEAQVRERNRNTRAALDSIGELPGLTRIDPAKRLCGTEIPGRCLLQQGGVPLYFDDDHLSAQGARLLAPDVEAALSRR